MMTAKIAGALALVFASGFVDGQTTSIAASDPGYSTSQPATFPSAQLSNPLKIWDFRLGEYVDRSAPILTSSDVGRFAQPLDPTQQAPNVPPQSIASTQTTPSKGEWLIAPLPSHSPEFGWGVTGTLGYIFPLNPADKISPPSTIAGFGYYSQNQSWAAGMATKLFIDEDRYRVTLAAFHGQINYNFFGTGTAAGSSGKSIPLAERMNGGIAEVLFRVVPHVYLGPRYQGAGIDTSIDASSIHSSAAIPATEFHTISSGLGLHGQWDTRDSQFYPHTGSLLDADVSFHDPALGDDFSYQVYQLSYNDYLRISQRQVLAFRMMGQFESGTVPFYALSSFGRGSDLRGYRPGQYQDKQMLAGQVEYRLEITKRIGAVAFGGVGEVVPSLNHLNSNDLLPGGGVGLRFVIAEKNHVSIRVDGAWGRDGGVYYLGVGEAF
jgi:hypothetical protein